MNNRKSYLLTFFLISSGFICTPLLGMNNKYKNGPINLISRNIKRQFSDTEKELKKSLKSTADWKKRALEAEELSNKYFHLITPLQNKNYKLEIAINYKNKEINSLTNNNCNLQKAIIDINKKIKETKELPKLLIQENSNPNIWIDRNKRIILNNKKIIYLQEQITLQQRYSNQYQNMPQNQVYTQQYEVQQPRRYKQQSKSVLPHIRDLQINNPLTKKS